MAHSFLRATALLLSLGGFGLAQAQQQPEAQDRGALLYGIHCIECHTVQMHWRTLQRARDWDSLKAEVRRWQGTAQLQWTEEDILAVTRHLNDTIYQFPRPQAARR